MMRRAILFVLLIAAGLTTIAHAQIATESGFLPEALERDQIFIGPGERVELLDGEVVDMSPINPPHASTVEPVVMTSSMRTTGWVQGPPGAKACSRLRRRSSLLRPAWSSAPPG